MARKKIEEGSQEERKKDILSSRILQIRQTLFENNNRVFSDKIGVNEQALSQICSGKRNAGIEVIQRITETIPEVDANWLLTGKGTMMQDVKCITTENPDASEMEMLRRNNEALLKYIALLEEKVSNTKTHIQQEMGNVESLLGKTNMERIYQ